MLQVFVNGTEIDINPNTSISVKLISPLFQYSEVQGSYSLPFNLPATPKNNLIFGFPHKLSKLSHLPIKLPVVIHADGVQNIVTGIISAKKTTANSIDCDIRTDGGAFADNVANSLLQEYEYGGAQNFQNIGPFLPDVVDYAVFPVENQDFFKGTAWDDLVRYGEAVSNIAQLILLPESSLQDGELRPVISEGIAYIYNALAVTGTYLPDDDTDGIGYWDPVPAFWLTNPIINEPNLTGNMNPAVGKVLTPYPFLYKIIRYLFSGLGYSLQDYVFSTMPLKYLTIFNLNDASDYEIGFGSTNITNPAYPFDINLKNHLSDISVKEFIKALQNYFNVVFIFKNNTVIVKKIDDILKSTTYNDYTLKSVDFYNKELNYTKTGVAISWNLDANDEFVKDINRIAEGNVYAFFDSLPTGDVAGTTFGDVYVFTPPTADYSSFFDIKTTQVIGGNELQILWESIQGNGVLPTNSVHLFQNYYETGKELAVETNISTLYDGNETVPTVYPECRQTGNSTVNLDKKIKNSFRLLFYKGDETIDIGLFSKGGRFAKDSDLYLGFYGPKGIIYNFWRHTIEYHKRLEYFIDRDFKLSASEIKNFDFSKKIRVSQEIFLVTELSVKFSNKGISLSTLKLLPDYNDKTIET